MAALGPANAVVIVSVKGRARLHNPSLVWDERAEYKGYPWSGGATAVLYEEKKKQRK